MPEINAPEGLASTLAEMARRLEALETSSRATATTIAIGRRGDGITLVDDAGLPVARFGRAEDGRVGLFFFDDTGGEVVAVGQTTGAAYGFRLMSPASTEPMFDADADGGIAAPIFPLSWMMNPGEPTDGNGRKTTTSASYSDLWRTYKAFAFGDQFGFNFACSIPGGTTVDMRITATEVGGSNTETIWSSLGATSATSQVIGVATITAAATASGVDSVLGRYFNIFFQVRRTAGAGTPAFAPIEQARIYP